MAYMNQDRKAKLAANVKPILKKYGIKGTLSTDRSSIALNIKSASIDFITNYNETVLAQPGGFRNGSPAEKYMSVNRYRFQEQFSGKAKKFLTEVMKALNEGNHDRSDSQTDYFDVGWYVSVNIGKWNKPFVVEN
jgi:hypothetical protein